MSLQKMNQLEGGDGRSVWVRKEKVNVNHVSKAYLARNQLLGWGWVG
jgi:hypothetical protein